MGPFLDAALEGGFPALRAAVSGASSFSLLAGTGGGGLGGGGQAGSGAAAAPSPSTSPAQEWERSRIPWASIEAIVSSGDKIGLGASSDVYRGRLVPPFTSQPQDVAVKVFSQPQARFQKEVEIMRRLKHPCVLALIGHGCDATGAKRAIVTDLLPNGTLEECLPNLEWFDRARIACDLTQGLHYLHTFVQGPDGKFEPILHGDIKVREQCG